MIAKSALRKQIIAAAEIDRDSLAGKKFLYCCGEKYFEVVFKTDRCSRRSFPIDYMNTEF